MQGHIGTDVHVAFDELLGVFCGDDGARLRPSSVEAFREVDVAGHVEGRVQAHTSPDDEALMVHSKLLGRGLVGFPGWG